MERETASEFGQALRAARESAGVELGAIVERTKISRRVLEALEEGTFGRLPDEVFVKLFLRQYLVLIRQEPAAWAERFAAVWARFQQGSQRFPQVVGEPHHRARYGPWIVGLAVVAIGVVSVMLIERGQLRVSPLALTPTPEMVAPTPVSAPTPAPTATPAPVTTVVLRATERPCWVEVRLADGRPEARLLAAGVFWELEAADQPVELVIGDAGALEVTYLGALQPAAGGDGAVVRLRLAPPRMTARP